MASAPPAKIELLAWRRNQAQLKRQHQSAASRMHHLKLSAALSQAAKRSAASQARQNGISHPHQSSRNASEINANVRQAGWRGSMVEAGRGRSRAARGNEVDKWF